MPVYSIDQYSTSICRSLKYSQHTLINYSAAIPSNKRTILQIPLVCTHNYIPTKQGWGSGRYGTSTFHTPQNPTMHCSNQYARQINYKHISQPLYTNGPVDYHNHQQNCMCTHTLCRASVNSCMYTILCYQ